MRLLLVSLVFSKFVVRLILEKDSGVLNSCANSKLEQAYF